MPEQVSRRFEAGMTLFLGTFFAGLGWITLLILSRDFRFGWLYWGVWKDPFTNGWVFTAPLFPLIFVLLLSLWLMYGNAPAEPLNSTKD